MHYKLRFLTLLLGLSVLSQPTALAGSAISVPPEARDTANAAAAAAQNIAEQQQADKYRSEAKQYVQTAELQAADAKRQLNAAEKTLEALIVKAQTAQAEAQTTEQTAQTAARSAADFTKRAQNAITTAKAAYKTADAIAADLKAKNASDWSKSDAAYARAERLNQIALASDKASERAEQEAVKKTALAETAKYKAAEANQAVLDAELAVKGAKENVLNADNYVRQTKAELQQLSNPQSNPQGFRFMSAGLNYYHWRGDLNTRGWQLTQPLYYGYWQRDFSYGLATKYVISQNSSPSATGRVNTFTDTSLYLTKRNETPHVTIDYNLNVNIPTGKSALSWSERHAKLNEDLVETNEFGKGWQFAPGINLSWQGGKNNRWTVGTSYTFSNSYDPTTDIANDDISPGGEWRNFLRWQHFGQDWQFIGELINTTSGETKIANGTSYKTGARWDYRLTYNRKLPNDQNIMYYYWREHQQAAADLPIDNSLAHFGGIMWSKKIDEQHGLRLSFDVMNASGNRFAKITNSLVGGLPQYNYIEVDGRTKYTAGIGYDIKPAANSSISIDLQAFRMKDGASPAVQPAMNYKGMNLLVKYNRDI